jgi:aminomethyltransferase
MKDQPMKTTPLHAAHQAASAKMGEFAGYDMPLNYAEGVKAEHEWTRAQAGLFDVSHMGQIELEGPGAMEFVSRLTPSDFTKAPNGRAKYTVLTNEQGGIVDDLIITRLSATKFFAVINAGCKEKDIAWIEQHLPQDVKLTRLDGRALIALQGPKAEASMREVLKIETADQPYMWFEPAKLPDGTGIFVSRLGYTGEDGFELSVPASKAADVWTALTAHAAVKPVGLVARDSLRLEMGYPLYGHDIDDKTSPVEAGLSWTMAKENRGFIGADKILPHVDGKPPRRRIGIRLTEPGIAREGAEIKNAQDKIIGVLSSGGFSPSLKASVGMGYVPDGAALEGDRLFVNVRGRNIAAEAVPMPFLKARTKSMKKQAA